MKTPMFKVGDTVRMHYWNKQCMIHEKLQHPVVVESIEKDNHYSGGWKYYVRDAAGKGADFAEMWMI